MAVVFAPMPHRADHDLVLTDDQPGKSGCETVKFAQSPAFKDAEARMNEAGKLPKVALVACMHKLLTTLNAMVRTNQPRNSPLHGS